MDKFFNRLYPVQSGSVQGTVTVLLLFAASLFASEELLNKHCHECHNDEKSKGKFSLTDLNDTQIDRWLDCLDLVSAEEMPPEDDCNLTAKDRGTLSDWLEKKIRSFESQSDTEVKPKPRRLNNREFANSVRDVLLLEDIGTNLPTANLVGDSLYHGFDTHSDTLGFSRFHLEQYIESVRKIVDATILSGDKPKSKRYEIAAEEIVRDQRSQNTSRPTQRGKDGVFNFLEPSLGASFEAFKYAPDSGHYKIEIRCMGKDRHIYDTKYTGFYDGDPIQLSVHLGDRVKTYDLTDEEPMLIQLNEWVAKGTQLKLYNPTDGFTLRGNGNFKFQYAIAPEHLKENDPNRYDELVDEIMNSPHRNKRRRIDTWHNWVDYWQGARPQVFSAVVEGPLYESWPPQRQIKLIGENPTVEQAEAILKPIAERAWRRPVNARELDQAVGLVKAHAESSNIIEAFKEGIVSVLVSPQFLILNTEDIDQKSRMAAKVSYFLHGTIPDDALKQKDLDSFESVHSLVRDSFARSRGNSFLEQFPYGWLELNDINFMAPDPAQYRFYHKKRVSEDMIEEVRQFFRHCVSENLPLTEFLSANYSFVNADLANIYGIEGVEQDSKFRKFTFTDGRRGGLLGMGAFLTSTADSLATSPIHRAIYVMENLMGIHPTPPPPDVEISEPDVRQAKTIKEILAAHTSDETCASCHRSIDPWGYAFENFDPTGAWRDVYTVPGEGKSKGIPIDSSARFRSGIEYKGIEEFREYILTDANRDRFVRCFITKLLTYANGVAPEETDFVEISNILETSASHEYRIVETISAVIDSPLFRNK